MFDDIHRILRYYAVDSTLFLYNWIFDSQMQLSIATLYDGNWWQSDTQINKNPKTFVDKMFCQDWWRVDGNFTICNRIQVGIDPLWVTTHFPPQIHFNCSLECDLNGTFAEGNEPTKWKDRQRARKEHHQIIATLRRAVWNLQLHMSNSHVNWKLTQFIHCNATEKKVEFYKFLIVSERPKHFISAQFIPNEPFNTNCYFDHFGHSISNIFRLKKNAIKWNEHINGHKVCLKRPESPLNSFRCVTRTRQQLHEFSLNAICRLKTMEKTTNKRGQKEKENTINEESNEKAKEGTRIL